MTDHQSSATARFIEHAQLFGLREFDDDIDTRPMPDPHQSLGAISDIFDALVSTLEATRMEPDLEELLWATTNIFQRAADRISRDLDQNERSQREAQQQQDGSEVRSVELERLVAIGQTMIDRQNWLEAMRDHAADLFSVHTGSTWRPRSSSQVNHRHLTAAMLDSRDFMAARREARNSVYIPKGPKVAVIGGPDIVDVNQIFGVLDKVLERHPDMVLLHGGSESGAELIADRWAANRKITRIAFKPDWAKHQRAAPFKRNDALLDVAPIGILLYPGQGVVDNMADKAKRLGIPVMDFRGTGG
ncbi:DUF2493 domain-containing protein [Nitrospirillum amazonense]|uniref:DUF2493 domain-containing protein n=1 Tax=Nitrospirillum amazonense TaxID=28077 RepID=UPI002412DC0A|nr:DUF2493 domain-containing protein [Nitrospirillum amazonense]MDG3444580.1 DUF2493 domain-containing protein [Nitrospirillum amazonense]